MGEGNVLWNMTTYFGNFSTSFWKIITDCFKHEYSLPPSMLSTLFSVGYFINRSIFVITTHHSSVEMTSKDHQQTRNVFHIISVPFPRQGKGEMEEFRLCTCKFSWTLFSPVWVQSTDYIEWGLDATTSVDFRARARAFWDTQGGKL